MNDEIPDEVARAVRAAVAPAVTGATGAPVPTARLAAFLADPVGAHPFTAPSSIRTTRRSHLMTRLLAALAKAGLGAKVAAALATGGVVALAGVGTISAAADHAASDRSVATVVRPADDASAEPTESPEPSESAEPTESADPTGSATPTDSAEPTDSAKPTPSDTATATATATSSAPAGTFTPNPVAAANHRDGRGADDQHADVHAGGPVDHRAQHSPAPRTTATATATATATSSAAPTATGTPTVATAR